MIALTGEKLTRMIDTARTKCSALDVESLSKLDDGMAVEFDEHFKFQQLQSQYHASGVLTPEAAQIVYIALGDVWSRNNGGWATNTDTATKVVVTQLMGELLTLDIRRLRDGLGNHIRARG